MTTDFDQWIRQSAGKPVDPDYPAEPASDQEAAWRQLDSHARAQGWDRADFATARELSADEGYQQWQNGRASFDPGYQPIDPAFGGAAVVDLSPPPDPNAALREAIDEAYGRIGAAKLRWR